MDISVGTELMDMYAKCGGMEVSHQLFGKMSNRDAVSWNEMIAWYAQNGYGNEALLLYHQMRLACGECAPRLCSFIIFATG